MLLQKEPGGTQSVCKYATLRVNRSLALQAKIFSAPLRRTENNVKITDKHTGKVFIMPQIEAKYLNRAKKSELKIL